MNSCLTQWFQGEKAFEDVAAMAKDGVKFIHNLSNGPSASTPHLYLSALPFAPEDSLLVKALRERFPFIVKVAAGHNKEWPSTQILLQGHTHIVTSVVFSPDGTGIVSGSYDNTVRVWDAERGVEIGSPLHGHTSSVTSVAFSPDSTRIMSGSDDKTVRVWDADRGVQIGSPLQGHTENVRSVAFSPDGTRIVSGSDDKSVRVWNAERGVQICSPLQGHTENVRSVAFSPDGRRIVSGSHDKTMRVWDTKRGVQIGSPLQGHTKEVTSVAFSTDGTRIVSGSNDNTVRVWDSRRDVRISNDIERDAFQSNEESMESSTSGKPISHFRDIAVVLTPMCNRRLLFLFGHDSNQ